MVAASLVNPKRFVALRAWHPYHVRLAMGTSHKQCWNISYGLILQKTQNINTQQVYLSGVIDVVCKLDVTDLLIKGVKWNVQRTHTFIPSSWSVKKEQNTWNQEKNPLTFRCHFCDHCFNSLFFCLFLFCPYSLLTSPVSYFLSCTHTVVSCFPSVLPEKY